jgi:plastocyanin
LAPISTDHHDDPVVADPDGRLTALEHDVARYRISRDTWTAFTFAFASIAAFAGIVAVGVAVARDPAQPATPSGETVQAHLTEFAIELDTSEVSTPGTIEFHNGGTMAHNIGIRGEGLLSDDVAPGESGLDISDLAPGTYEMYCAIAGHADSGMTTELTVGADAVAEDAPGGDSSDHAGHTMTAEGAAALDQKMTDSISPFPAETKGRGNIPLEPEILRDGTKHFELSAALTQWVVSLGNIVEAWSYNGMVPGPHIELVVGDKARSPSPMSCHSERMSTGTASTSPTARTVWPRSRRS